MSVLVCLAHQLTEAQVQELGEFELLKDVAPGLFGELVQCPSNRRELAELACKLFDVCKNYKTVVLPIGSPAFMWEFSKLSAEWCPAVFSVRFAHSERKSVDVPQEDGTVKKNTVFEHQFFF